MRRILNRQNRSKKWYILTRKRLIDKRKSDIIRHRDKGVSSMGGDRPLSIYTGVRGELLMADFLY